MAYFVTSHLWKFFERLIYNNLFEYFIENDLTSQNQSGFKPGDSCINRLISITHEIYLSFDERLELRGVFLYISKAFYKVLHEGLIYKLKQNRVKSNLLDTLGSLIFYIYKWLIWQLNFVS